MDLAAKHKKKARAIGKMNNEFDNIALRYYIMNVLNYIGMYCHVRLVSI